MIVIGLVGRIGAGKSTVARRFAELGAMVVDADRLAHEVLAEPDVVAEVVARFGSGVRDGSGRLDRTALAGLVFGETPAHDAALAALESIVHPRVRQRIEGLLAAEAAPVVVLDVPLLVQAGWADLCTDLVVVDCEESVRRGRLEARGWSPEQIAARDRAWDRGFVPPRPGPCTWSVDASGDPAYTRAHVDRVWWAVRGR
ncbi:MAG: dephospho-CoA kinase [Planctomycetaceae bacterium]